jgi:hypothetical protein
MTQKIYVKCPMDGTDNQKYCGLIDHYKQNGTANECLHRQECADIKTYYIINDKEILNEIK